ncbi:MAG TPA: OmpA family protein [Cytophagaceae bacterium]|nr:OmpA family protein [Cytophagaceae bacterium]
MKSIVNSILLLFVAHLSYGQQIKPKENEAMFVCLVTDLDKVSEENAVVIIKSEDKTISKQGITDVDGRYVAIVPKGKKYNVTVKKFSYDFKFVSTVPQVKGPLEFVQNYVINLFLDFRRSYCLNDVFFEPGKWDIKEECIPVLDSLVNNFKTNERFRAEIAGYTDNVGNDTDNMRLSQRRADAIRAYVISKGVSEHRVLAKGYGEKFPVADNGSETGRSRNRRTEVKVIME